MKKRMAAFLAAAALAAACAPAGAAVDVSARSAILMDADTGEVLYSKDADTQRLIASTTKIMTALVALERGCLTDRVPIKRAYTLVEGSSMYLKEGENLSLETLLYGLLLCSGNDAALAVADYCGGEVDGFVLWMNQKAAALGMTHTAFANPNGLDHEKHYSSARDMAVLAAYAMDNPTFARMVSTRNITIEGRSMHNHNKLLSLCQGCIGLKTGFTRAAGRTLVSYTVRDGRRLVAVTLNDGDDWNDHRKLYDFGFSQ